MVDYELEYKIFSLRVRVRSMKRVPLCLLFTDSGFRDLDFLRSGNTSQESLIDLRGFEIRVLTTEINSLDVLGFRNLLLCQIFIPTHLQSPSVPPYIPLCPHERSEFDPRLTHTPKFPITQDRFKKKIN